MKYAPHALSLFYAVSATEAAAGPGDLVPTSNFEKVRVEVIDPTPSRFTINMGFLRNMGVDRTASNMALFEGSRPPSLCADFRHLNIRGERLSLTKRQYNLSGQQELITAMEQHRCIVVPNNDPASNM